MSGRLGWSRASLISVKLDPVASRNQPKCHFLLKLSRKSSCRSHKSSFSCCLVQKDQTILFWKRRFLVSFCVKEKNSATLDERFLPRQCCLMKAALARRLRPLLPRGRAVTWLLHSGNARGPFTINTFTIIKPLLSRKLYSSESTTTSTYFYSGRSKK